MVNLLLNMVRMKKARKWSYQLNESTDTGKYAQLMVYVRYECDTDLEEKSPLCTPLTTSAIDADIFNVVDNFQKKKTLTGKTVSVYALTAFLRCLVLDRGSLHKSSKLIIMSELSTVFFNVKTLLRNICSWLFWQ